jgi:hypothetical protein
LSLSTTGIFYAIRDFKFSQLRCSGICIAWYKF